jgi:hypothetical protein
MLLLFAALALAVLGPAYLKNGFLFRGDALSQLYASKHFTVTSLKAGVLPYWAPHVFAGVPHLEHPESGAFFPANLLYVVLPFRVAFNFMAVLHVGLAGFFMSWLVKELGANRYGQLMAGVTFMFSTYMFSHFLAGWSNAINVVALSPAVFLFVRRVCESFRMKDAVYAGMALALQLLAGWPQFVAMEAILLGVYAVSSGLLARTVFDRRTAWLFVSRMAAVLLVAAGVGAVYLLAAHSVMRLDVKSAPRHDYFFEGALNPFAALTLLDPLVFGSDADGSFWGQQVGLVNIWETTMYVGIPALVLAALAPVTCGARATAVYVIGLATSLLLATGQSGMIYGWLWHLPGYGSLRLPVRYVSFVPLWLSVLSGLSLSALTRSGRDDARLARVRRVAAGLAGGALVAMAVCGSGAWGRGELVARWLVERGGSRYGMVSLQERREFVQRRFATVYDDWRWTAIRTLALVAVSGGALLWLSSSDRSRGWGGAALVGLAVVDLLSHGAPLVYREAAREVARHLDEDEIVRFLKRDPGRFRIQPLDRDATRAFPTNKGMLFGIESIQGYGGVNLRRYYEFANVVNGYARETLYARSSGVVMIRRLGTPVDMLNVRYVLSSSYLNDRTLELVAELGMVNVYRNLGELPRAFDVYRYAVMRDPDAILTALRDGEIDVKTLVVLEEAPTLAPGGRGGARKARIDIREYSPERIRLETDYEQPGFLVLSEIYYPAWVAYLDGAVRPVLKANYILRAVEMPAGVHRVELRYQPTGLRIGALISVASIVACAAFLVGARRKKSLEWPADDGGGIGPAPPGMRGGSA